MKSNFWQEVVNDWIQIISEQEKRQGAERAKSAINAIKDNWIDGYGEKLLNILNENDEEDEDDGWVG